MKHVRRLGMQPFSKRPAPARNVGTVPIVQTAQRAGDAAIGALTDEQLDSLLGDVDIDAVIAASGKKTAQVKAVGIGGTIEGGEAETKHTTLGRKQGGDDTDSVMGGGRQPGDELGNATPGVEQGTSPQAMEGAMGSKGAEMSEEDAVHPATARVGLQQTQMRENGQRTLSKADEAMIDSLLEGLDGSDF